MSTARLDLFVFGYRKIEVPLDFLGRAASLLLSSGISARILPDGSIYLRERDFQKCRKMLGGRVRYTYSELLGIPGIYSRIGCKMGILVGCVCSLLLTLFLSGLVWDVRIEGNFTVPDVAITEALEEAGFTVGSRWNKSDLSSLEVEALSLCSDISWININRRGTVAYVSVIEKDGDEADEDTQTGKYANIIASDDCIIEELRVVKGTAEVKVGDAVKKGDLLISGVLSDSANGGLCYAEGIVIGRVGDSVTVNTEREYERIVPETPRVCRVRIKIFKFPINIFKNSRNFDNKCDIIKDIDGFSLFGRGKLPIEIVTEYCVPHRSTSESYNDKELVSLTSSRLTESLSRALGNADLVRIRTTGEFTDTGYLMRADIVYLKDVSHTLEFD